VISDSDYWKEDLKKNLSFFHRKLEQRHWRDTSFVTLEKRVMLSCYIARKLIEAGEVEKEISKKQVKLYSYKNLNKEVTKANRFEIEELYQINKPKRTSKPLSYVIDQMIHSYTFMHIFESKNKINGFAFNSDRSKSDVLYLIKIIDLIHALSAVAGWRERIPTIVGVDGNGNIIY
jgi:hypothetical protein